MNQSIYRRGLNKLISDGASGFFRAVLRYFDSKTVPAIDKIAKKNHIIGGILVFLYGLSHKEIVFKTKSRYIRYTPFCNNIFGRRKYYFPDLKHHKQIELYERYNLKYFKNEKVFIEPGDTVVEIGAARGITTQIAAQRGTRIIAFEPSPRGFRCLKDNIIAENVELYRYAAWNESDKLEMKYGAQSGDDSIIQPNTGTVAISEKVRADTIERFSEELNIDEIDFLKIEAEGAEPEVVEGIGDASVNKIVVNCSAERYGESPMNEVSNILEKKGYSISTEDQKLFAKNKT